MSQTSGLSVSEILTQLVDAAETDALGRPVDLLAQAEELPLKSA